jgi:hypothetical protein
MIYVFDSMRVSNATSDLHHEEIFTLVMLRKHLFRPLRRHYTLDSLFTSSRVIAGQPFLSG